MTSCELHFSSIFHLPQRREVVTGSHEPNDEECHWSGDEGQEEEEEEEEEEEKQGEEGEKKADKANGIKNSPLTLYQPMTHICVMSSHRPIRIYMGGLILDVNALYRFFCFFKLFPMVGKGLRDDFV